MVFMMLTMVFFGDPGSWPNSIGHQIGARFDELAP